MSNSGFWTMNDPFVRDFEKEDLARGIDRVITTSMLRALWLRFAKGYRVDSITHVPVSGPVFGVIRYKKKRVLISKK